MRIAVFIEPGPEFTDLILDWKSRVQSKFGDQPYLSHPPHSTICTMDIDSSVSETDYTAPNIEGTNPRGQVSSARSTPLIGGDPDVPYGYEENILDV